MSQLPPYVKAATAAESLEVLEIPERPGAPPRRLQRARCAATGRRLLKSAEIDHRTPLFRIRRERRGLPWPTLLGFSGLPNLQVVNRYAHLRKSSHETSERRAVRRPTSALQRRLRLTSADVIFYLSQPLD